MAEKLSPLNGPTSRSFDALGYRYARRPGAREDAVDIWLCSWDHPRQLPWGQPCFLEDISEVLLTGHVKNTNTATLTLQGAGSYSLADNTVHNLCMSRYLQQPALKAAIKAYQARTNKTQSEVAGDLGTTLGTLRQWLNNKNRRPELESLQKISALTGVSVSEFIDDPGRPGAAPTLGEMDRMFVRMIEADVTQLSEKQKLSLYESWSAILRGYEKNIAKFTPPSPKK